jgi:ABC-type glycerol-3-phosphate transport system substrate-binding protein
MANGLMYDLSTLCALDFSEEKFQLNMLHDQYSKKGAIYCMFAGPSEPRTGVYFNKTVLRDAGIDPDEIYELQKNDQWTWDKFDEYMDKVQRDVDNDGTPDYYGLTVNEGNMTTAAIFSNGGSYVGKDASGYFYNLESPETTEALNWTVEMFTKYDQHDPIIDGEPAPWDYYKEEFHTGTIGFMVDDEYCAMGSNFLEDMDGNIGFVMFPKGRSASAKLVNVWSNNPVCIPANYDKIKAGKLAFAWNLYTEPVPGFEDYNSRLVDASLNGHFDERAKNETIPMMVSAEHGTVAYHGLIADLNLGPDFVWGIGPNADVAAAQETIRDTWKTYIDAANK